MLSVAASVIPKELLRLDQWVVYRIEQRDDGKSTKIPYQPRSTRLKASSTNAGTWSNYTDAVEATERLGSDLSGIGFVFTREDPYCGVDLDHCLEEGVPNARATQILEMLGSYAEYSPSGTGIHILVKASIPVGHKCAWLEIYSQDRYFTMTGNHVPGTPRSIQERQEEINWLCATYFASDPVLTPEPAGRAPTNIADTQLLNLARNARNGTDFASLYDRGESDHNSQSEADLALCNHLAFWTGRDATRMDTLFRASALYRRKWDEKHGQQTYGQMTIGKAIQACQETYSPPGAAYQTDSTFGRASVEEHVDPVTGEVVNVLAGRVLLGEAIRNGVPETHWLIPDILVRGAIHMLYGEPESGKTIMALSWMLYCVENELPCLYIDEESGLPKVAALLKAMGADPEAVDRYVHYFPFPGIDKEAYSALLAYADALEPVLCTFDSLTDMLSTAGLDENSGIEVTGWMLGVAQALARRPYQPAVSLVDHVTKDTANVKYSVASRAKKAKSDVLWYVEKIEDFDQTKTSPVDLHRHKNRPGSLPKKVRYIIGGRDGMLACERFDISKHDSSVLEAHSAAMLKLLQEHEVMMTEDIAKHFGVTRQTIANWGKKLTDRGLAERLGENRSSRWSANRQPSNLTVLDPNLGVAEPSNQPSNLGGFKSPDLTVDGSAKRSPIRWNDDD